MQADSQLGNYLETEYLFNMLPSYMFLLAASLRYWQLRGEKVPPKEKAHDSFLVKVGLCHWMALSYLLAVVLAFLVPPGLFWQSRHPLLALIYLAALFSWSLCACLLHREHLLQREQEVWTHKIFWSFSSSLNLVRMFQANEIYPLNMVFNTSRFLLTGILTVYAVYKPYDYEDTQDIFDTPDRNTPASALNFFRLLEANVVVRKLLFMKGKPQGKEVPLMSLQGDTADNEDYLQEHLQHREDIGRGLLDNISPKRVVAINKRVVPKETHGKLRYYFQIVTQIDTDRFIAERRYAQFEELQNDLGVIYRDFPSAVLPCFQEVPLTQDQQEVLQKRVVVLENYLKELLHQPVLVHKKVLEFLNVSDQHKAPFLAYFRYVSFQQSKGRRREREAEREESESSEETASPRQTNPMRRIEYYSYQFEVGCVDFEKVLASNTYEYVFQVSNLSKTPRQSWRVFYSYPQVKRFHQQLQQKLGLQIPYLANYVPSSTPGSYSAKPFLKARQEGLNKYMKLLLSNKQYYCQLLMDFLQFDVAKDRPSSMQTPRHSASRTDPNKTVFSPDSLQLYHNMTSSFPSDLPVLPVRGLDFNRLLLKVFSVQGSPSIYYLVLLEFGQDNRVKSMMKTSKTRGEIEALGEEVGAIYYDLQMDLPRLPLESTLSPSALKAQMDAYFLHLLHLPRVEQCASLSNFLELERMASKRPLQPQGEVQVYDFVYQ